MTRSGSGQTTTKQVEHEVRGYGAASRHVELHAAGEPADGDFRCPGCGYGAVVVQRVLPLCPMCGGEVWEQTGPQPALRTL